MSRFKLSSITKAVTEAINAAPDVDALSKSLGAPPLAPRIVAEYGSMHSATCLDYDPVQRLLAVGVATGVKVLGAGGLSVLLATPRHLEPARCVRFVSSVGRVIRVSVESGIDIWDLRSQTLLASTRWPNEVIAVAALRRSPFILLGEASGAVRVAAAQPGAGGGVLAMRAYAVTPEQAMGIVPWKLRSVPELQEASSSASEAAACVAVEPQPGFETTRALFAYADGRLAVWDLHAKKPAAVTSPSVGAASLRCATWVGNGGGGSPRGTTTARCGFGSCPRSGSRARPGATPSSSRARAHSTRAPARTPTSACPCARSWRAPRALRAARWRARPPATAEAGRAYRGATTETPKPPPAACWRA